MIHSLISIALAYLDGSEDAAYRAERAQWEWLLAQPESNERNDFISLLSWIYNTFTISLLDIC